MLARNMDVLRRRFPALAQRLDAFPGKDHVRILRAQDGSVAYGVEQNGRVIPVTDVREPTRRMQAQLDQMSRQLTDFTRPVLFVGLYPGNELIAIFDQCEKVSTPHCPQPITVCVDSTVCLQGFLQTWDVANILESPRVRFVWHEDIPELIGALREHPEIPHVFTLVSGAGDRTLNTILPPLAALIQEREAETRRLQEENNAYYNGLDDVQLAQLISGQGGRKPRLMMPTASWSTFIQHSTRDTCAAFDALGWETRLLRMEAMMTPYYLVSQLHEFKPDVFLFIDHLRYEAEEVYPRNMMYVAWVQDEMANIHCLQAGQKLQEYAQAGKRDLVIGHTERLDSVFGYPKERLTPMIIPADPRVFYPITLSNLDRNKYGCEIAFMSNCGLSSERAVDEKIAPVVESLGISRATVQSIHDRLWTLYRAGAVFSEREAFLAEMMKFPEFEASYNTNNEAASPAGESRQDALLRIFLWGFNDTIYRHVALEWLDELGLDLHLYGHGWEQHPRFSKYARGILTHGPELNIAYQAAHLNLHLNITYGMHQRLWEIMAAGAQPLLRYPRPKPNEPPASVMREFAEVLLEGKDFSQLPESSQEVINDYVFTIAYGMAQLDAKEPKPNQEPLETRVMARLEEIVMNRPAWLIPDFEKYAFHDKATMTERLEFLLQKTNGKEF